MGWSEEQREDGLLRGRTIRKPTTRSELKFWVNGKQMVVGDADPKTKLGDFLRDEMLLRGLQLPCRQGGCGACTVVMSTVDGDGQLRHRTINSCLKPLCSVDGVSITTVEGVGSWKKGLHPVQEAIVKHNGTQCGFCTPGMVMSMCGLLMENSSPDECQVEDQLDGNLCRCTGYRPILDAFQTFSCKAAAKCSKTDLHLVDLEDLKGKTSQDDELQVSKGGVTWIRVTSLSRLSEIMRANKTEVQLVCGNTGSGIYPQALKSFVVDVSRVPELSRISIDSEGVKLGGASTLTDLVTALSSTEELRASYEPLLKHLKRVATHQIRNVGSIAGNLMLAYGHSDFVSDIATILSAVEATMVVYFPVTGIGKTITLEAFFELSTVEEMIILQLLIPSLPTNIMLFTYKVALRRVNSHPIVNAGFKLEVDRATDTIKGRPVIVYGGVKTYPVRAKNTEIFLAGKCYKDAQVCDDAVESLLEDLAVDTTFEQSAYRSSLVPVFFYKAMLSLWPKNGVPKKLKSSLEEYSWPISSGAVSYDEGVASEYPVSQPLPKLSAGIQATGEAQYLDDVTYGDALHATYVLSTIGSGKIKGIDASKALQRKGVVTFISAQTILDAGYSNDVSDYEQLFASDQISYCGQAIGLIIATSKSIADNAAKLVSVEYTDVQKPILTIDDAIAANSFFEDRGLDLQHGSIENAFNDSDAMVIEGQVSVGHQYHFHLETQRAVCIPSENGFLEVYSSTQNPSQVQHYVGVALNRPEHKITVNVKKVGGAYGAKINRSLPIAMACACAADLLQRPVRLALDLSTNMQLIGGRSPYLCKYKVSAKSTGEITAVQMSIYNNHGAHCDFEYPDGSFIPSFIDGAYNIPSWEIKAKMAKTNLPACTYMRGPVFVETTYMIEAAIEQLAAVLNLPPDQVRAVNMYKKGDVTLANQQLSYCNAKQVFDTVKDSSNYEERRQAVDTYNSKNLWVKRGISIVPIKFVAGWEAQQQLALVNIYSDGSISIHQSGCEIGQGLDIKVAQVAAMVLGSVVKEGVSVEKVAVHTTTTTIANNVASTGGSVTSEMCAKAVHEACTLLVDRLHAVKKMLMLSSGNITWTDLIAAASEAGVDLQARGRVYPGPSKDGPYQYVSFGAAVTEVQVDILTGETCVLRADVLLDCGRSLNPAVDVGQVQGAFVQGLGYFLSEEFRYDEATGKLVTDGTWEYKPPSQRDIPCEFNVSLLKDSDNPSGFLRSKFSGEPPYALACSAILAVAQAIRSSRSELGMNSKFSPLDAPATVEKVALAADSPLSFVSFREMLSSA